ncbi:MAG: ABC transporter permease [Candidatus Methylacidiphilales bacterium]
MTSFLIRRILWAIPVVFIVLSGTFLLIRLSPGSPFGSERNLDPAVEARLLEKFQLDGSWDQQLVRYWKNALSGDLGVSTQHRNRTVTEILGQTLPKSAALGAVALVLALGIGIVAGTVSAAFHNTWVDRSAMLMALLGICLPGFVLAPLFVLALAILIPLFPVAGWGTAGHLVLPALCLALPYGAYCARLMRTSMLEVLNQDFIRTARARGLMEYDVLTEHALKVAILPLVSYTGPLAAHILTGSIIIEEIFKIPGLGPFFVNSVLNKDVFMAGGCVLTYCLLLVGLNIIVDVLYTVLDKRVKLG